MVDTSRIAWAASLIGILATVVVARSFVSLSLLAAPKTKDFSCAKRGLIGMVTGVMDLVGHLAGLEIVAAVG